MNEYIFQGRYIPFIKSYRKNEDLYMSDINQNNNNEEYEDATVSMTLEDGTELECDVVAIFPVDGKDYIALLPDKVIDGYEENEVFLYRYTELEGEDIKLEPIDDEEEYEAVADAFDELLDEEEFNELDEE